MDYRSVGNEAEIEYTINKSRFIGRCAPAATEQQALELLAAVRKRHSAASHNCYAYRVRENGAARYSDDGEPGGTAGLPMMEALLAKDVTDTVVVVTRYFGGVLLGASGLVRAYTKAASGAVEAAGIVQFAKTQGYALRVPYALYDRLAAVIRSYPGADMEQQVFADDVSLEVYTRLAGAARFEQEIADQFGGRIAMRKTVVEFRQTT